MANEHWYVLKVRSGFERVVAHKLRRLHLEVFVPDQEPLIPQQAHLQQRPSNGYVYCRFALENRLSVTTIPGVLDILGTPEPSPVEGGPSSN